MDAIRISRRRRLLKLLVSSSKNGPELGERAGVDLRREHAGVIDHRVQRGAGSMEDVEDRLQFSFKRSASVAHVFEVSQLSGQVACEGVGLERRVAHRAGGSVIKFQRRLQE
ncbi:hypothetical protein [Microvirga brassicacearum]|uniref:hypothetical protein n=1 Tax=Microvirga brassicacearum TaxID=2580413 RepID=UPI001FCE466F|nr:hypothetical protein [Microvirga brassicacearum]